MQQLPAGDRPGPFPPLAAADLDGDVFCPGCGRRTSARPPPDWLREIAPAVVALIGEQTTVEATSAPATEAMTIHCMSCGGTLPVDGTTRTVHCTYCATDNLLPDPLWLRLDPAATVSRWYVVIDADPEAGMLPAQDSDLIGIAADQTGELVVAYGGLVEGVVAGVAPTAALRWKWPVPGLFAESRFGSCHAEIVSSPDGHGVIARSPEADRALTIDTRIGVQILWAGGKKDDHDAWTDDGGPERQRPFHIAGCRRLVVDTDYSMIVLQDNQFGVSESGRRRGGPRRPFLTRYQPDGTPRPMWADAPPPAPPPPAPPPPPEPPRRGFFSKLLGGAPEPEPPKPPPKPPDPWRQASWGSMPPQLRVPPDDVLIAVGLDGRFYVVDEQLRHLAAYDKDGTVAEVRTFTPPERTGKAEAIAVDAAGTLFALAEIGGLPNVLRAPRGEPLTPWIGLEAPGRQHLGSFAHHLAVAVDGRIYVAANIGGLRAFDREGQQVWRSPATRRLDEVRRRQGR